MMLKQLPAPKMCHSQCCPQLQAQSSVLRQVYLSVDALVNKGSLDLVGALLEANSVLESLGPEALKARRAKQQAEMQAAAAADKTRQIARYDTLPFMWLVCLLTMAVRMKGL